MAEQVTIPEHWVAVSAVGRTFSPPKGILRGLHGLAEAIFCDENGPPPKERLDWVCADVDDHLRRAGGRSRLLIGLALQAVTWIGPLFVFRLGPLQWLSLERRVLALERMDRSPFGLAVLGVKAILCMVYYEHPDVARAIRFDGTCMADPLPKDFTLEVRR